MQRLSGQSRVPIEPHGTNPAAQVVQIPDTCLFAMRCSQFQTELKLRSAMPNGMLLWLGASCIFSALYVLRASTEIIPPQDHVALSLVLCLLLSQVWVHLEQTSLRISLHENRCWLSHHRLGSRHERSLPVSQIHSAKLEYENPEHKQPDESARIALVTSLGMIPVSDSYHKNSGYLDNACNTINEFLASQSDYLQA